MHRVTSLHAAARLLVLLAAVVSGPALANPVNNTLDTLGTVNLVPRSDMLGTQWVVRDEQFAATTCSVQEGGVQPGTHKVLRFTVGIANSGDADLFLGDPNVHIANNDGLYEFATCHRHYHFKNYTLYELIDSGGKTWRAAKRGFCMLDTDPTPSSIDNQPPRDPNFASCGQVGVPGNQGISHGWTDTYRFFLGGQYFVLDGGDGQAVVPPGTYTLRVTAVPPYKATKDNPCRFLDPRTGDCHAINESSYTDNTIQIAVTIPDHPGRAGVGPLAGDKTPIDNDKPEP